MATIRTAAHNHSPRPFGQLLPRGECPRCDARRSERAAEGITDHNHEPLPYGRRKPHGDCPRCDELHDGLPARPGFTTRRQELELQSRRDLDAHLASAKHRSGGCGPVCTYGDW
jgi:hypothetical protein